VKGEARRPKSAIIFLLLTILFRLLAIGYWSCTAPPFSLLPERFVIFHPVICHFCYAAPYAFLMVSFTICPPWVTTHALRIS
jgi:hypothetical protein